MEAYLNNTESKNKGENVVTAVHCPLGQCISGMQEGSITRTLGLDRPLIQLLTRSSAWLFCIISFRDLETI